MRQLPAYTAIPMFVAALVAGGMGYQTGEWQGWLFAALFGGAGVFILVGTEQPPTNPL